MSSLSLDVSIPAVVVIICVIFVDPCLVKRTSCSGNHPGPMKVLTTITLRGSHKLLRVGSIRSPAALPRMAVRGRAFLSERHHRIRIRCYKGGVSTRGQNRARAVPTRSIHVRRSLQSNGASMPSRTTNIDIKACAASWPWWRPTIPTRSSASASRSISVSPPPRSCSSWSGPAGVRSSCSRRSAMPACPWSPTWPATASSWPPASAWRRTSSPPRSASACRNTFPARW